MAIINRIKLSLAVLLSILSAITFVIFCQSTVYAQTPVGQKNSCETLKNAEFTNTSINITAVVPAGSFEAPGPGFPAFGANYSSLPTFCRVAGSIKPSPTSDIRFELWLPTENWNGKFLQTGNGGAAGSIVYNSLIEPLSRGYAVANTDTGHQGGGDFSWALDAEKLTDFAYRSLHELTVVGKLITETYYGRAPNRSYWNGCSTGGRQGLKEAQFFPEDYDGIIAGAPANNWNALLGKSIEIKNNLGPDGLPVSQLVFLKESSIDACDAKDGVVDRVISRPDQCTFDPVQLQCKDGMTESCLTEVEVKAANDIYKGLVDSKGDIKIPGSGPASEPAWAIYASPQFAIGPSYYRYAVHKDENWDPATFTTDKDFTLAEQVDNGAIKAMDPDLSEFVAQGGKLIMYHGTTDGLIPYGNSVNYFNSVIKKLGINTVDKNMRFYLMPGTDHCSGGEGAHQVDWLTALDQWVDNGKAPTALEARHPAPLAQNDDTATAVDEEFSRPLCPYPQQMEYKGSGDNKLASNFVCVIP